MSRSIGMLTPKERKIVPPVKMTPEEFKRTWDELPYQKKVEFALMYKKLVNGELMLTNVNVDDNERIKSIELADKNRPSAPAQPFYGHFKADPLVDA